MRLPVLSLLLATAATTLAAEWKFTSGKNVGGPGEQIEITRDGRPVARLIHGEGQKKVYLHVLGENGELLTNPGLDADGKEAGLFPHHRGIYIGWNKIESDCGSDDLWHLRKGEWMSVQRVVEQKATADAATLGLEIEWRSARKDGDRGALLLTETRTLVISKPDGKATQVDARFQLKAARNLALNGDLQHAGIHFRAHAEVATRQKETSYLSDPENKDAKGPRWKPAAKARPGNVQRANLNWARLLFPVGDRWYSAMELNSPGNPSEELSWRAYGRFGFFFKHELKQDETLDVRYRFLIAPEQAPANPPQLSKEQEQTALAACVREWNRFVKEVTP